QRPHVPKFGNWTSDENVPYTVYFDQARKNRTGGKMINPNDPQENPGMFPNMTPLAQDNPEPKGRRAAMPGHERRVSREDGDLRQFSQSPAHYDNTNRRAAGESAHQRRGGSGSGSGSGSGRPARKSAGSEQSFERSPLHPHYQAKVGGRGSASPAWEGKNSYDSSHGTPGRSKMKPATPDRGPAVPKFGQWDENNPASAEGFTHIFNEMRAERHIGAGKAPVSGNESSYTPMRKQNSHDDVKVC
ncbi:RPM1-interacting protein, partial [Actinidia chinensis var. chinensis]